MRHFSTLYLQNCFNYNYKLIFWKLWEKKTLFWAVKSTSTNMADAQLINQKPLMCTSIALGIGALFVCPNSPWLLIYADVYWNALYSRLSCHATAITVAVLNLKKTAQRSFTICAPVARTVIRQISVIFKTFPFLQAS